MTTIFRVEKNANYVVMSNHHLRNKEMTLKAKGLLSLILSLPETWNYSLSGLCAICKESQTAIRSALKELEKNKYLVRKRQKNELGHFVYEYIVYEVPYIENQYTDNQHAQNVHTENRTQISKEELSINKLNIDGVSKEKEINKEDLISVLETVDNIELIELYQEYIEVRESMGVPLTARTLKMLIARNRRLSKENVKIQKLLLENAIINNWKNIFLPSESELNTVSTELATDLKNLLGIK